MLTEDFWIRVERFKRFCRNGDSVEGIYDEEVLTWWNDGPDPSIYDRSIRSLRSRRFDAPSIVYAADQNAIDVAVAQIEDGLRDIASFSSDDKLRQVALSIILEGDDAYWRTVGGVDKNLVSVHRLASRFGDVYARAYEHIAGRTYKSLAPDLFAPSGEPRIVVNLYDELASPISWQREYFRCLEEWAEDLMACAPLANSIAASTFRSLGLTIVVFPMEHAVKYQTESGWQFGLRGSWGGVIGAMEVEDELRVLIKCGVDRTFTQGRSGEEITLPLQLALHDFLLKEWALDVTECQPHSVSGELLRELGETELFGAPKKLRKVYDFMLPPGSINVLPLILDSGLEEFRETRAQSLPAEEWFRQNFPDPIYWDDAGDEGPFGSDEGADLWEDLRYLKGVRNTRLTLVEFVAEVLGEIDDAVCFIETIRSWNTSGAQDRSIDLWLEETWMLLQMGFALIRMTCRIDEQGRQIMLDALQVLSDIEGSQPEFAIMVEDLRRLKVDED